MESRSNAAADQGAARSHSLLDFRKRRFKVLARNDLQVGAMPRTNLLLVGSSGATRIVLDMLRLELRGPVIRWQPGQPLVLPPPGVPATLVLDNPIALTREDQQRIVRWLEQVVRDVRVVSTTAVPLWPHVQAGEFNETLYYRLNTMCLEVGL